MGSSNAQLTEEAMWEREWERFPGLGRLLGAKQIPDRFFGFSSISDNAFDDIRRLMKISILVRKNPDQLRALEPTNEERNGKPNRSMRYTETSRGWPKRLNASPGNFMRRARRSPTRGPGTKDPNQICTINLPTPPKNPPPPPGAEHIE